jgi:hypothetical protein
MIHVRYTNIKFTHQSGFYLLEDVNNDAYRFFYCRDRVAIFREKKLFPETRNRQKFSFIPSEFRLFRGTENIQNFVLSHSTEEENFRIPFRGEKRSECRSEPLSERKNFCNNTCWLLCQT